MPPRRRRVGSMLELLSYRGDLTEYGGPVSCGVAEPGRHNGTKQENPAGMKVSLTSPHSVFKNSALSPRSRKHGKHPAQGPFGQGSRTPTRSAASTLLTDLTYQRNRPVSIRSVTPWGSRDFEGC